MRSQIKITVVKTTSPASINISIDINSTCAHCSATPRSFLASNFALAAATSAAYKPSSHEQRKPQIRCIHHLPPPLLYQVSNSVFTATAPCKQHGSSVGTFAFVGEDLGVRR
jgi:hypothetical protein